MRICLLSDVPVDSRLILRAGNVFTVNENFPQLFDPFYWIILPDGREVFVGTWQVTVLDEDSAIVDSRCEKSTGGKDG